MNVSVAPSSIALSQARPITVAVLAMGGQGGGVLVDWIVALAERRGWFAQSTSVPGVAQRTGATIYYIEMIAPDAGKPERHPVLSLMPAPGKVDIVIGAELMEAGRAILRGLVSPDRTLLIGSSHRSLAVVEKTAPGDGTADASQVYEAANVAANRFIAFDMAEIADATGSVVSSVLFGALAGSGALPFTTEDFEATIRAAGVGVDASLRAFTAGREQAVTTLKQDPKIKPTAKPPLAKRFPRLEPIGHADYDALVARARQLPEALHGIVAAGLQRVVDYQDIAYGREYLDRLEAMPRDAIGLMQAFAKYLAIAMAYDDVIRVADLKTRAGQFDRVRREARAGDDQILGITEFFHPRIEEMAGLLPPRLGEKIERSERLARLIDRGRRLRTTSPSAFLMLYCVAGLRRFRRRTLRHSREMHHLDEWAQRVRKFAASDVALATAVCEARRLVGGYSDTHSRGEIEIRQGHAGVRAPGRPARCRRMGAAADQGRAEGRRWRRARRRVAHRRDAVRGRLRMDQFEVVVSKAEALTPRIREFVLARANGAPMPGWAAGAHIDVHLPDVGRRSYSLIETTSPRAAAEHPTAYRIAVLQESKSRGGSTFMHGLKTGDRLTISPPANNFPLRRRHERSRARRGRHRRDAAARNGLRVERGEAAILVLLRRPQPQRTRLSR